MIVSVAGTHGTGKTTLAYSICTFLKKNNISAVVLDERARECPFPINKDATNETQVWLIASHIKKELELMSKYNIVISDRCVLDSYVYGTSLDLGEDTCFKKLLDYCVCHIKKYYKRLYLLDPVSYNYCIDDGVRSIDSKWRLEIHELFKKLFTDNGIQFKELVQGDDLFGDLITLIGE